MSDICPNCNCDKSLTNDKMCPMCGDEPKKNNILNDKVELEIIQK